MARAREATKATGIDHVPVFWMATEDHDLAEVDQVSFLTKTSVETLRLGLKLPHAVPVGDVMPGSELDAVLERASEYLSSLPSARWLRDCYAPVDGKKPTLALAFGRLIARLFAEQGLIVMDASTRGFHALGASTLRYAIEHAAELQSALIARGRELEKSGYHAQVLVPEGGSMLFLVEETSGERVALRRNSDGQWKAGGRTYSTADLLKILETAPERLSPNACSGQCFRTLSFPPPHTSAGQPRSPTLLRAQYSTTQSWAHHPRLPRLSATLLEPAVATIMDQDEIQLPEAMTTPENLAQRLGARAMPIEGKRKLAAAGNALDSD